MPEYEHTFNFTGGGAKYTVNAKRPAWSSDGVEKLALSFCILNGTSGALFHLVPMGRDSYLTLCGKDAEGSNATVFRRQVARLAQPCPTCMDEFRGVVSVMGQVWTRNTHIPLKEGDLVVVTDEGSERKRTRAHVIQAPKSRLGGDEFEERRAQETGGVWLRFKGFPYPQLFKRSEVAYIIVP
jgi:hypothetical protein